MTLNLKPADSCRWDQISLGEVMLRLDPGETRIRNARHFEVWEGGGEYNVARGLRRCFGLRTALVSALPDNDIGLLLESLILQGGVDMTHVVKMPFDGIGADCRAGLNFTERGFGLRGAVGISDRANSAASKLGKGDIDWNHIFANDGARWLHTGGIYAGLSGTTPLVVLDAVKTAQANGTCVSYDLNYRPSLWKSRGGTGAAQLVNRDIARHVDVMIGNEEDFCEALGFEIKGLDAKRSNLKVESFAAMIEDVVREYPNIKAVATTLRRVHTANSNDWSALLWLDGTLYQSHNWSELDILDRVGGGDSFASGLIYGFLSGKSPQQCVDYGAAHGALAMTTPGDTSMATLNEVEKLVRGGNARVER